MLSRVERGDSIIRMSTLRQEYPFIRWFVHYENQKEHRDDKIEENAVLCKNSAKMEITEHCTWIIWGKETYRHMTEFEISGPR